MKKLVFIFLIAISTLHAQENRHEKIKALKTAYITEKLSLSPADAEKFWPIYNKFDQRFHELREKRRNEVYLEIHNRWDELTDTEANALFDRYIELKFDDLELLRERTQALRTVISPKKIISLNKVEEDFKRELLDRYRKQKSKE